LCWKYYANFCLPPIKKESEFFLFLLSESVAFFDGYYLMKPVEQSMRISDEAFLPVGFQNRTGNRMRWTKFQKDEQGQFKFNLLYSLQLHEVKYKKIYDELRIKKGVDSEEEYLLKLYTETAQRRRSKEDEKLLLELLLDLKSDKVMVEDSLLNDDRY